MSQVQILFVCSLPTPAATGLVRVNAVSHVLAGDASSLLVFTDNRDREDTIRLLPDKPPVDGDRREPALTALCRWPVGGEALLALGSGSTAAGHRGCLVRVAPELPRTTVESLDLAPLHTHLAEHLPALHLAGAVAVGDALVLLHRGDGSDSGGALVELDAAAVARTLAEHAPWTGDLVRGISAIHLGETHTGPRTLLDACALPDGSLVVLTIAETTHDQFGSIVRLAPDRTPQWIVDIPYDCSKCTGIHAELEGDALRLWLVAESDERERESLLYTGTVDPATGLAVNVKKTVLVSLSVLVDIDELELAHDSRDGAGELTQVTDHLIDAVSRVVPGGWQSLRRHVLDPSRDNCGRCAECNAWVTDRERPDTLPGLGDGATYEGRLLCDDHLPPDHPWAF